jgi:CubicO group peptidase (beta-lactamase class C family)
MIAAALPRLTPAAAGIDPAGIAAFIEGLDQLDSAHSVMLLRHGAVVAEAWWAPYSAERAHSLFSVSKSFTSTAVGFAISEELLSLDDRVIDLLPDDVPAEISPNLAAMRVRDLLTMTTGHAADTVEGVRGSGSDNWAKVVLAMPVEFEPGTHFVYDTGATYLLSAILHRLTGMRLLDYLTPRLFEPLGITGATWEQCPRGIDVGGWGLAITTEEMAVFGQLLLQHGEWNGLQVVPRAWLDEATSLQVPNGGRGDAADWEQGYGYQFWRARHGAYRGDGAFGQYVLVMEDQDAVLVTTGGMDPMHQVLELAWEHLIPAFDRDPAEATLPSGLSLPTPAGSASAAAATTLAAREWRTEQPGMLQSLAVQCHPDRIDLTIGDAAGRHLVECGVGRWVEGSTLLGSGIPTPIAASAAWQDDVLHVVVQFIETPFAYRFAVQPHDDGVDVDVSANVSFGPTELGRIQLS